MYTLDYPLLTDEAAEVAGRYGVTYDWWDAYIEVPKRTIFLSTGDTLSVWSDVPDLYPVGPPPQATSVLRSYWVYDRRFAA